eukprot:GFYU01008002.1.p1 GENE.GFYU01008002.1~~GFYU01008002.1.p1  ORF type:complete len:101 (-),score=8.77 GFYU01008002.1:96-398(-)
MSYDTLSLVHSDPRTESRTSQIPITTPSSHHHNAATAATARSHTRFMHLVIYTEDPRHQFKSQATSRLLIRKRDVIPQEAITYLEYRRITSLMPARHMKK